MSDVRIFPRVWLLFTDAGLDTFLPGAQCNPEDYGRDHAQVNRIEDTKGKILWERYVSADTGSRADRFLTHEELVDLTGRKTKRLQAAHLQAQGIPFQMCFSGARPLVAVSTIEKWPAASLPPREIPEDFKPFEGLAPLTWMKMNWHRFNFNRKQIVGLSVPYPGPDERRISGIYFLIEHDEIVYVGMSNHVGRRLVEHSREKVFSKIFAFEAPDLILPHIEIHYIDSLSPPLNMTRLEQQKRFHSNRNTRKRIIY